MKAKNIFALIIITFIVINFISCKHKKEFMASGNITGQDFGMCICCGGYFIATSNDTFRFDTLPAASGIDLSKITFPMKVKFDYLKKSTCGNANRITITDIEEDKSY